MATNNSINVGTAAAGKVLQSAGAGVAPTYSTPTYPSASGTSRKIIVSDGTNNVYSTETWAVPGTSGNVLTSDGTNWTSSAPATGDSYTFQFISGQFNPADSTNYYLTPATWGITSNNSNRLWIAKSGTITKVYGGVRVSSTLGSSENTTVAIRLNDTTNTTISSTVKFDSADSSFSNTGLSISVTAGDYINVYVTTPAWVTNPQSVFVNVSILVT